MLNNSLPRSRGFSHIFPYVRIARPDHWFKNIFMVPGVILAIYDSPELLVWKSAPRILLGFLAACLVASSNYVINEIIDAPMDKSHPEKKNRPIPTGKVELRIAYVEWILLGFLGLYISSEVGTYFFWSALGLLAMGLIYNVPPIRSKDLPYVDVLSESVNNPIRLFLGWYATGNVFHPPLSLVMAYWMIGAFFMAVKRFAEYRYIANKEIAGNYRKSFRYYSETTLLIAIAYYCTAFGLFGGIFLVRYRIELILAVPFLAGLIAGYLRLGFLKNSPAQYPERLIKQPGFVAYTSLCFLVIVFLLFVDMPFIGRLFAPLHMP
jgi:decaprenyl-phosphate phosphoribosyltransferase